MKARDATAGGTLTRWTVVAPPTLLMALTLTLIFVASRFAPDVLKGR